MDIFTVSLFGHREIQRASEIEERLEQLLYKLITQKQYVEFLIGRDGEFDLLAASAIRRATKQSAIWITMMKLRYAPTRPKYTISLRYKFVTGVWLTVLIWSFAVFSTTVVVHIKLCSMLCNMENLSEIWLTANFDSGLGSKLMIELWNPFLYCRIMGGCIAFLLNLWYNIL